MTPQHRTDRTTVLALAAAIPPPEVPELDALRARLARDAEAAGLLEVGYRTIDSPVGPLLVAVTGAGVVRVAFDLEGHEAVLADLARHVGPRILRDHRRTDEVVRQLDEYFAGTRHAFDLPVDLRLVSGFRRQVIEQLPSIAYGATASYAEVARRAGNPTAVRAVGTACGHNPVPLVVPCHRVVRSDGSIGRYLGGVDAKAALLALEAAA